MIDRFKKLPIISLLVLITVSTTGCVQHQNVDANESSEVASAEWVEAETKKVNTKLESLEAKTQQLNTEINQLLNNEPPTFNDVSIDTHSYAYNEIQYLLDRNIIKGYPDEGKFYPNKEITRYQAASMLIKALNLTLSDSSSTFSDIADHHYAKQYAMTVFDHDLFKGLDGEFLPGEPMKRSQMASVLVKAFQLKAGTDVYQGYSDISDEFHAYEAIKLVTENGIAKGSNGKFMPNNPTTRAQFALFLARALDPNFRTAQ